MNSGVEFHYESSIGSILLDLYKLSLEKPDIHWWLRVDRVYGNDINISGCSGRYYYRRWKAGCVAISVRIRTIAVFLISLLATFSLLYTGDAIEKHFLHQRMEQYSLASAREDGTPNRVVMNGKLGFLGHSSVHLSYLKDGWIRLIGDNAEENDIWILLSTLTLEPGTYSLTGMKGQGENTIALQLYFKDETGFSRYIYQYDEDVYFSVERSVEASLHVRVYPEVEGIDVKIRPAVYKDE